MKSLYGRIALDTATIGKIYAMLRLCYKLILGQVYTVFYMP